MISLELDAEADPELLDFEAPPPVEEDLPLLEELVFPAVFEVDDDGFFLLVYLSRSFFLWLNGKTPHHKMVPFSNFTAVYKTQV